VEFAAAMRADTPKGRVLIFLKVALDGAKALRR
jgi:hypothetical protein